MRYRKRKKAAAQVMVMTVAVVAVLAALLVLAAREIDWIGLQAQAGLRAGWMALVLAGVALLYFVQLQLSGLRLQQFLRRA